MDTFNDLTIKNIEILSELYKTKSLRALARSKEMAPGQLTKLIKELESIFNTTILKRSNLGVQVTKEGEVLSKKAIEVLSQVNKLQSSFEDKVPYFNKYLTFASRGFLSKFIAQDILSFFSKDNKIGLRFLETSPEEVYEMARHGLVDFGITLKEINLGPKYMLYPIGTIYWSFYSRVDHPLNKTLTAEELSNWPIGKATYWDGKMISEGDDFIDLPKNYKNYGYEYQTTDIGITIAQETDHLVYLPDIVTAKYLKMNILKRQNIKGLKELKMPAYLFVNIETFPDNKMLEALKQKIQESFTKIILH